MRGYLSRFWRRNFAPSDRRDREALEQIAARVWGKDGPEVLRQEGGVEDLLSEIARRVPLALESATAAAVAIDGAIRKGRPVRFRVFVEAVELGVYVEGRNATFTHLGGRGAGSLVDKADRAAMAWACILRDVAKARRIEGQAQSIDGAGRLTYWARFAD